MKNIILIFIIFGSLLFSQEYEENGYMGKEFLFAIPPSDVDNGTQPLGLYLIISSIEESEVLIKYKEQTIKINLKSNETKNIELTEYFGNDLEVRESNISTNKTFYIESSKPIFASILNYRIANSEGFSLIPINLWSDFYIHNSYYDFSEVRNFKGGFIVVASEDQTKIKVNLKGKGKAKTDVGNSIGDEFEKILNRGETLLVRGDGSTKGEFDLSGSQIRSDKAIALFSFHERTMLPINIATNGRDHLVEMMPPAKSLDKEHFIIQLDRGTDVGDLFRIVAVEDNTTFDVDFYSLEGKEYIGHWDSVLDKAGDFIENKKVAEGINLNIDIKGLIYIKSNNPVLVVQYSNSQSVDNSEKQIDPFMVTIPPINQYSKSCFFSLPKNNSQFNFTKNVNLLLNVNDISLDNIIEQLESIKINNKNIFKDKPELLNNIVPINVEDSEFNNKIYWLQLSGDLANEYLLDGLNQILSDSVKFYGIAYGVSDFNSYGYPIARTFNEIHPTLEVKIRNENEKGFVIYPNPAKNYVEMSSELGVILEYMIIDLEGKLIKEGKSDNKIYVGDLSKGTYLVRCKINNKYYDKKLIVE